MRAIRRHGGNFFGRANVMTRDTLLFYSAFDDPVARRRAR
jgi:hypothetical protein